MIPTPTRVFAGIVTGTALAFTLGFVFIWAGVASHINVFLLFGIFAITAGIIATALGAKSATGIEQTQGITVIPADDNALVNAYVNEQLKNRNKAFG